MTDFSSSSEECSEVDIVKLKTKFNKAADYVQTHYSNLDQNILLEIYGLYKQATCGKCNVPKPSVFNFQAKAKWQMWNSLGMMPKEEAMHKYIEKVETVGLNLKDYHLNSHSDKHKKAQWVCLSLPTAETEEISENKKSVFDYVKEQNLDKVKLFINSENINDLDEFGIGIIHWAADRNSLDILEYIVKHCCADLNLRDTEKQTALHYASSCGHIKCVELLLKFGAEKELSDASGQTSLDVAFDDNIKSLIQNFN